MPSNSVPEFQEVLSSSKEIFVIAGAGLSAPSGIPTFRGSDGMWTKVDPLKLATVAAWKDSPSRIWKWFHNRREMMRNAKPNAGHIAVAKLSLNHYRDLVAPGSRLTFVTQNIDGLSKRALDEVAFQCDSKSATEPIEMHGHVHEVLCTDLACQFRDTNTASSLCPALKDEVGVPFQEDKNDDDDHTSVARDHFNAVKARLEGNLFASNKGDRALEDPQELSDLDAILTRGEIPLSDLPRCRKCGALARPGVVLFGEVPYRIEEILELVNKADLCLVIGTSSTVHPAAKFASTVKENGGKVAVFNIARSKGDEGADFLFLGPCEETLPTVLGLELARS